MPAKFTASCTRSAVVIDAFNGTCAQLAQQLLQKEMGADAALTRTLFKAASAPPYPNQPQALLAFLATAPIQRGQARKTDLKGLVFYQKSSDDSFQIFNLCVDKDYRDKGVGCSLIWTALLSIQENMAKANIAEAEVSLVSDRKGYYEKFGFKEVKPVNSPAMRQTITLDTRFAFAPAFKIERESSQKPSLRDAHALVTPSLKPVSRRDPSLLEF